MEKIFLRDKHEKSSKVEDSVERFICDVFHFCNAIVTFLFLLAGKVFSVISSI